MELEALRQRLNHVRSDLAYFLDDAGSGGPQHTEEIAACRAEAKELEQEINAKRREERESS